MKLKKALIILFCLLIYFNHATATHNRSGSITYRHISGNTYEFTVKTCTKTSAEADRPELEINWGDGTSDTINRINIVLITTYDAQENYYVGIHTYTGPGNFIVSVEDPNRNSGVLNITNSVNQPFCVQTEIVISPLLGTPNNSLIIEDCPCPEFACLNQMYCYNLSAYDPDGDSLSYSLVPCRGQDCLEMTPGIYSYPQEVGGGVLTIDSITGTLCWDSPVLQGEYNIAIKISEYRAGVYIGSVLQDMQLTVKVCNNDAPIIAPKADTCVFVGDNLDIVFSATDTQDAVSIYATGAIFNLNNNPATFIEDTQSPTVNGHFIWQPDCSQASYNPYPLIIHAVDLNPNIQLQDLMDWKIRVNIPPLQNVLVSPYGSAFQITWDAPTVNCDIDQFNIYRSTDSSLYSNACCDVGTAEAMGYTLIGTSNNLSYIDDSPLEIGNKYCYMVTVVNTNGVESCVSNQDCNSLNFEVPVMTNVSVFETALASGKDSVYWSWPKELNLTNFPGPYYYQLYRSEGYSGGTESLVFTSNTDAVISNVDTFFYDISLNTIDFPYTYRVELYSNNQLVGSSSPASSIYLNLIPNDNQLTLVWDEHIPWINYTYEIYKETFVGSGVFNLIGTTNTPTYTDTNLINQKTYCYKIKTIGQYTQSGIRNPIENWSQIQCGEPYDYTPPCAPSLSITGNCDTEENLITWTNPNNSCADDVVAYNLYFAPFEGDSLTLLTNFSSQFDTMYIHKDRGSIAGCYYVTAIDSMPYSNEGQPSNMVCIDNCNGYYELPNVFTPGNDNVNDLYHPFLPFKFVESIDLKIYNRWGELVYETTDPQINWDGTYLDTGKSLLDGVYFYVCTVYEIKLAGLISRSFQGNITIINDK
ncbi:MAG TPA: gliding motility-associated C-terminal domain-containing protein [Crocinitomix sp.]|nr:gliding motility-associated C-terminal domain-containing protein [Crocinitomix sp.]